jgi:hypothetical protein
VAGLSRLPAPSSQAPTTTISAVATRANGPERTERNLIHSLRAVARRRESSGMPRRGTVPVGAHDATGTAARYSTLSPVSRK